jgi:serine/threonine protein kinase
MTQPSSPRLRPFRPARFGRYALVSPLAVGGMGEVFLARLEGARGFEKPCVIKKILPHLAAAPDFVERFVAEARVLVKLSHGNIAQVLDMGVEDGAPYIALEFIDGKDARKVLARLRDRQDAVPLGFALYVASKVLDALAYAHRKRGDDDRELGLVHRDISPQNVLVSYEGEVKVIDFGLAKSTLSTAKTSPSILLGKFLYMSPEQARHQRVDRRSDLYAVGLLLYELIAQENPFAAGGMADLMARVQNPQIPPLRSVEPRCPQPVHELVMKALAVEPAQRFQTAEEFRARLQSVLFEVDPEAGPESSSQLMREVFAAEYASERKQLSALRDRGESETSRAETRESNRVSVPERSRAETVEAAQQADTAEAPRPLRRPSEEPSVVVDQSEAGPLEPAPVTVPMMRPGEASTPSVRKLKPRRASASTSITDDEMQRLATAEVPDRTTTDTGAERSTETRQVRARGSSVWAWLVLPIIGLVAIGGWLLWDRYADAARLRQLEADRRALLGDEAKPERRREVLVGSTDEGVPAPEPQDLADVPVVMPKRPSVPRAPPQPALSAAQLALTRVRRLHSQLTSLNADAAAKYRLRIGQLSDQISSQAGSDVAERKAQALAEELEAAIDKERL